MSEHVAFTALASSSYNPCHLPLKCCVDRDNSYPAPSLAWLVITPSSVLLQKAVSSPTVSRLTDTTKFTGSHKERFDQSGKGKGKAGRVDLVDESGYVPGYKHAGTYDQKVQGGK